MKQKDKINFGLRLASYLRLGRINKEINKKTEPKFVESQIESTKPLEELTVE